MFKWHNYASCVGMDTNLFFDSYEEDPILAVQVDKLCGACLVKDICLSKGVSNKETGVWGGVYLKDGRPDKIRNAHKT